MRHVGASESEGAVAKRIIAAATAENASRQWEQMGPCGLVVGATVGQALVDLGIDLGSFNGPILSPGYGAQGASAADLYRVFAGVESQVLVNSSRGALRAHRLRLWRRLLRRPRRPAGRPRRIVRAQRIAVRLDGARTPIGSFGSPAGVRAPFLGPPGWGRGRASGSVTKQYRSRPCVALIGR